VSSEAPVVALLLLDLLGVFAFALSGGLVAVRKEFDILGVVVLAVTAGLGGGVLRDLLIGAVPPVGVSDWRLVSAASAAGLVTFAFHPSVRRTEAFVRVLDAIGLGFFAVAGSLKALELDLAPMTAVIVGVLTGIGGGMIRDLLAGEVPHILAHRELYAIPAFAGTTGYVVAWSAGLDDAVTAVVAATLITGLRLAAIRWDWRAPAPRGFGG
jgi:uncharacterized membrane protein YeiH